MTVQSQLCEALTFSSMISHHLACEWKNSIVKWSKSDLHIIWRCYIFHLMLIAVAYPTLNLRSFSCHGKSQQ